MYSLMLSVRFFKMVCNNWGSVKAIFLISRYSRDVFPSTRYVARVYRQLTDLRWAVSSITSSLSVRRALATKGAAVDGLIRCIYLTPM